MAEGFRRAGIEFDFVFDYDADACDSYEQNLKHCPVRMDVRDLVRMAKGGWRPGPIGLLVADPPCTPWSRAGKRLGTEDERDMLEETAELIVLLRPRAYLIGNVPGLQDSTSWHVVQRVIGGLRKHGYCVADYATLDAADYGVAQHRIRPFWYGHLDGPCVRWPAPSHGDPSHPALPGLALKPWVTCRAALGHLPIEDLGRPVRLKKVDFSAAHGRTWDNHPPSQPDEPSRTIKCNGGRNAGAAAAMVVENERHAPAALDAPAATIGAKDRGQSTVLSLEPRESVTSLDRMVSPDEPHRTVTAAGRGAHPSMAWPWDRPATSVYCDPRISPPGHHDGSFLSAKKPAKKKRPPSTKGPQWSRVSDPDAPAPTVLTDPDTSATSSAVKLPLAPEMTHTHSIRGGAEEPAGTVVCEGRGGGASGTVMRTGDWPWSRPSTTVCAGIDKIAAAGEHSGHLGPNAVVLSERAAAILQGFPESWVFSGATKKARWSMIGQAMPPPLAEAVARRIRAQMEATSGASSVHEAQGEG